jgi:Leucine-rich repeat (LRR) protein
LFFSILAVPLKVWRINELDENEKSAVSMSLDDTSEDKWWEFVELQKLIVANNYIKDIPCDVSNLLSLQTLDVSLRQFRNISF